MAKINKRNYNATGKSDFENSPAKVWHVNNALNTFNKVVWELDAVDLVTYGITNNATVGTISIPDVSGKLEFEVRNSFVKTTSIIMVSAYIRFNNNNEGVSIAIKDGTIEDGAFVLTYSLFPNTFTAANLTIVFQIFNP